MDISDDPEIASLATRVADDVQEKILEPCSDEFIGEWRRRCSRSLRRYTSLHTLVTDPDLPAQLRETFLRFWFVGVLEGLDTSPDGPADG